MVMSFSIREPRTRVSISVRITWGFNLVILIQESFGELRRKGFHHKGHGRKNLDFLTAEILKRHSGTTQNPHPTKTA